MYLDGYVVFRRCGGNQQTGNRFSAYSLENEKSWRPYEGSRRLATYDFTVTFKQRNSRSGEKDFGPLNIADESLLTTTWYSKKVSSSFKSTE